MNYKRPLVQKREGERRPGGQVKGGGEAARVLLGVCWVPWDPLEEAHLSTSHATPPHLSPSAGSQIGAPTPSPAGLFLSGKRIWAEIHSALQKNLFQLYLTVLCQKRKITRPMKTYHHLKEGHHFSKDSKVFTSKFHRITAQRIKHILAKSDLWTQSTVASPAPERSTIKTEWCETRKSDLMGKPRSSRVSTKHHKRGNTQQLCPGEC